MIKNYVILMYLFIFSYSILNANNEKYKLVWALEVKKTDRGWWEQDWVRYLFGDLCSEEIFDDQYNQFVDQAIIVVGSNEQDRAIRVNKYLKQYADKSLKFVVIHLADEHYTADISFYKFAPLVIRNYWHKDYGKMPNVRFFPLGYRFGFYKDNLVIKINELMSASHRKNLWSFAGQITKSSRMEMMRNMKQLDRGFVHLIDSFGAVNALGPIEYRNVMLETAFIPCPRGWTNLDSFRVYEALECGAIPIVEKDSKNDYFLNLLGHYPFPSIRQWNEVPTLIKFYSNRKFAINQLQRRCFVWWNSYKRNLRDSLMKEVKFILK